MSLTIKRIQEIVARSFSTTLIDLLSDRRDKQISAIRHTAMLMARRHTKCSLPRIGRAFQRDHTSIMNGCRRAEQRIKYSAVMAAKVAEIEEAISAEAIGCRRPSETAEEALHGMVSALSALAEAKPERFMDLAKPLLTEAYR